jgi:hypothetical protein
MSRSESDALRFEMKKNQKGTVIGMVGTCSECGAKKEIKVDRFGNGKKAMRYLREEWFNTHSCISPRKKPVHCYGQF